MNYHFASLDGYELHYSHSVVINELGETDATYADNRGRRYFYDVTYALPRVGQAQIEGVYYVFHRGDFDDCAACERARVRVHGTSTG